MRITATKPLFPPGQLYAGALEAMDEAGQQAVEFLHRHQSGDWGEMSEDDRWENDFSVDID